MNSIHNMKKTYTLLVGTALLLGLGCSSMQKLPSVTVGGAANKDAWLSVDLDKSGFQATAPLVDVSVPFPTAELKDGKKK
tara:strand:+ start:93 stop:332 length:240 start_codon:yes stop_codon:yes gene_type:complete